MNAGIRCDKISECVAMNKETRKDIAETFSALEKMLLQVCSAEVLVKSTPGFDELFAKAKAYSQYLTTGGVESRHHDDFGLDIAKAVEAIEFCQSEVRQDRDGDEWLHTARERIRGVIDRLKDW